MAISFVGSGGGNGGTGDATYNFSSLLNSAGATPTLLAGDVVIVTSCRRHTASLPQTTPSGYSTLITHSYSNGTTQDTNLIAFYKVMGSTPDTSFTLPASGVAAGGSAFIVHVLRGVDMAGWVDGGKITASGTGATATDPPPITPTVAGSWIFCVGGACAATASLSILTKPAALDGQTNVYTAWLVTSGQATVGGGFYPSWVSGSFNVGAFGGGCAAAAGSWVAVTICLKPAATGGKMKVWSGSAWVEKPVKVWNGSAWVEKPLKVWNGSAWVLS